MELKQLYALYYNDLYRYLYSLSKNHADAEDLLQETFAKAYIVLLSLGLWGLGISIFIGVFVMTIFVLGWTIVPFP